jgi:alpha-galactosidase
MGWNSYCTCNCEPSEKIMTDAADALVDLGLRDCGYEYVNLDDGWLEVERDENGRLVSRDAIFPHGMKWLTDYIHAKGLKAGTYLGCGMKTWNGDAGTLGHEFEDAKQIAEWGFDYLKYDRHPMEGDGPRDTMEEYIKMGLAIKECGREVVYNLCEHGTTKPWTWAQGVGQLWRIGGDIRDNFASEYGGGRGILDILDGYCFESSPYTAISSFNDPDMLVVGMKACTDWMGPGMTDEEYRTQFSMWCLLAAPLLIGANPAKLDEANLAVLKNKNLIAINQDPLCLPARRVRTEYHGKEIWVRQLSDFRWAVAIINRGEHPNEFDFRWEDLSLSPNINMDLRDEWTDEVINNVRARHTFRINSHETKVFTLTPVYNK